MILQTFFRNFKIISTVFHWSNSQKNNMHFCGHAAWTFRK